MKHMNEMDGGRAQYTHAGPLPSFLRARNISCEDSDDGEGPRTLQKLSGGGAATRRELTSIIDAATFMFLFVWNLNLHDQSYRKLRLD